jgi:hypothetical protein
VIEAPLRLEAEIIHHAGEVVIRLAVVMLPEVVLAPEDPLPRKAILEEVDSHQI